MEHLWTDTKYFDPSRAPFMISYRVDNLDALLTTREAAALLRLSERTLERHRTAGTGPKFRKFSKAVRYGRRDVLEFIERAARESTSEPAR